MQETNADDLMYKLVKYRDIGMHTYTYFWVDPRGSVVSSYYNSEEEAKKWDGSKTSWDDWKSNKSF